jgi:isoleucyl-tRNA synthetase
LLALDAAEAAATLQSDQPLVLKVNGQEMLLESADVIVLTEAKGALAVASDKGVTVAVDVVLTSELVQEGYARDLVRAVNNLRKEAGFDIADRIELSYQAEGEVATAFKNFRDYIMQETLAVELSADGLAGADVLERVSVGDDIVTIGLRKA